MESSAIIYSMVKSIGYDTSLAKKLSRIVKDKSINLHRTVLFLMFLLEKGADKEWTPVSYREIEEVLAMNLQQQIRTRKLLKELGLLEERRPHKEEWNGKKKWSWAPMEYRLTGKFRELMEEGYGGA